ncbi:MAG: alpha/beta hydrolase [Bdellovibrionales bacterium]|nr:alpha/beta hydrolase [Bdellovibrionales bacterium]
MKKINSAGQGQVSFVSCTSDTIVFLRYALFILLLLPVLISFPQTGRANTSQFVRVSKTCLIQLIEEYAPERAKTLARYSKEAEKVISEVREQQKLPRHGSFLEEMALASKWQGVSGPQAFEAFLPNGLQFLSNPTPNSEHPLMAGRLVPESSAMARVNFNWRGNAYGTDIYFTKPIPTDRMTIQNSQGYLIGPEIPVVYWRIHGGGTPSAVASNASTTASFMVKHGIATVAVDQQGHGRGIRDLVMSMEEQVEMNLEIMRHLVHPEVKVLFDGHSWGGQAAYVAWLLDKGDNPLYKQIIGYIAESPPGDVTLGGSSRERLFGEEVIWKRLVGSDRHLVAESDWNFMNNIIRNLKISMVAPWATDLTFMGYKWNPISAQDLNKLKPLLVIVGQHDGLVYVGREEAFQEHLGKILPPNRFVVLGPGRTYENAKPTDPLKNTGHQISDRYRDGKDKPDTLLRELEFVSEISKRDFPEIKPNPEMENAVGLLYRLFLLYSNNFAARAFFNDHVEYIHQPTPELVRRQERSTEIIKFFARRQTEIARLANRNETDRQRTEKEFDDQFKIKGGYEGARKELEVDHSPERKRILHDYVVSIDQAEKDAGRTFDENPSKEERIRLVNKYGEPLVSQIETSIVLKDIKRTVGIIRKSYEEEGPVQISQRIEHLFRENGIDPPIQTEIDSFLSGEIDRLKAPPAGHVFKNQKMENDFPKTFASAEQALINLKRTRASRYANHIAEIQRQVPTPKGINRPAEAMWEMRLLPLTPERRFQLSTYIRTHGSVTLEAATLRELRMEQELAEWEEKELSNLLDGDFESVDDMGYRSGENSREETTGQSIGTRALYFTGDQERHVGSIHSPERALYRRSKLAALEEFLFITGEIRDGEYVRPFTTARMTDSQKLRQFVGRRKAIKAEIDQMAAALQETNASLSLLRTDRNKALKTLATYLSEGISNGLNLAIDKAEKELSEIEQIYAQFSERRMNTLLELEETGQLTKDAVLGKLDSFTDIEREFTSKRDNYLASLHEIKMVRLEEAQSGNIISPGDIDGSKTKTLIESLLGDFRISEDGSLIASPDSLEGRLLAGERERDNILAVLTTKKGEWNEIGMRISEADQDPSGSGTAEGNRYTRSFKIEIKRLLDHNLETVLMMLTEGNMAPIYMEALRATLTHWESQDMWRRVLQQQDDPKNEWYALKGH